jgi:hypothetical protein
VTNRAATGAYALTDSGRAALTAILEDAKINFSSPKPLKSLTPMAAASYIRSAADLSLEPNGTRHRHMYDGPAHGLAGSLSGSSRYLSSFPA